MNNNAIYCSPFILCMNSLFLIGLFVLLKTTSLTSLSWCNSRGVNSTHHCHYNMALADSKFEVLSGVDIDSLFDDTIGPLHDPVTWY